MRAEKQQGGARLGDNRQSILAWATALAVQTSSIKEKTKAERKQRHSVELTCPCASRQTTQR